MAVTKATQVWAYSHGLVPFGHLAVGERFHHPATPGVLYVKVSQNGWYTPVGKPREKYRGNAGTAVKLVQEAQ